MPEITLQRFNFTGDFAVKRGANWTHRIIWKNPDGTPVDNTGMGARMQVRKKQGDPLMAEFSTGDGRIILGGSNGYIDLVAMASYTETLEAGEGEHDLELYSLADPNGDVFALLEGEFEIKPNITDEDESA